MESAHSGLIVMAALSQPFNLGMLYDCRADKLVPGLTLWDHKDLESDMRETAKPNSEFEIVASESISDKSSSLGVEASLKASFLSGLINVEGSAKYLNDNKTSKHQARVTLQYKTTTEFKELTMNHLGRGNMKHPYVFDQGLATHVVTAILYGAQAFFVFDREVSEDENLQDIQGNLKVMINKIPMFSIEGEGSLKMEDKDREKVSKFSCKFYGDFCLDESPVTFEDAVKVYQDLPKLLGPKGERAVPVKVWLLPLTTLDSSAAKLVRQISVRLVLEAQSVLEDFGDLEMRCNDVLKSTAAQQFPQISKKLKTFMAFCSEFKLGFQGTLAKKLPAIRGGGEDEAELAEILKKRISSPFNSNSLNQWIDCREREVYTLLSITHLMTNTKVEPSQSHLYKETSLIKKAVCFVFTSLGSAESYLSALENYLKGVASDEPGPRTQDTEKDQWHSLKEVRKAMTHKARLFSDFAEANKDNKDIRFLAVGLTDENHKGSTIYLYEDGFQVGDNFEPPSRPDTVTVGKVKHNSVSLKFSAPTFGAEAVTGYRVEYCVSGKEEWKNQTEPKADEVTVRGLSPNTEYSFRVRAVTDVGVGPAAQIKDSLKTLPCSPPRDPEGTATSREITVHWRKPAEMGQDVQILRYIVSYGQTENRIQWKEKESISEKVVISGLQPQTSYTVRVLCDCGVNGRSEKSATVNISTKELKHPPENIKQTCVKINSEIPEIYKLPLTQKDFCGYKRYVFGEECEKENRNIILLGFKGADKTTLINGMINYIFGVKWNDSFRFKLTEDEFSALTVYEINHQDGFQTNYSLTIIDCSYKYSDEDFFQQSSYLEIINFLFLQKSVTHLDALCLVDASGLEPFDAVRFNRVDDVLSIFGDLSVTSSVLVTCADGQVPPVLKAITEHNVQISKTEEGLPLHYKFNTSALFVPNQSLTGGFDELCWNMGNAGMKTFFDALDRTEPRSLTLTEAQQRKLESDYFSPC